MIKLGNNGIVPKGYSKIMRGSSLVWKKIKNKNDTQSVSWNTAKELSQYANVLIVPREYQDTLRNKEIISVELKGIGNINRGIKNDMPFLSFSKSFDESLEITSRIPIGTEITVTYK